ncbi:CBASS cGAMP-activated phospholipase [Burkholderia glumae]
MPSRQPLAGVRVHLSGSVPDAHNQEICLFVKRLCTAIFNEGGAVIHGSHPSFTEPLEEAARAFIAAGGEVGALTLVRAQKYAQTPEQIEEIERQRQFAVVQVVPAEAEGEHAGELTPMRDWMAQRSDVVICVGGRWWDTNKAKAGVPTELDVMLDLGKPAFVVAGFGGAISGYLNDNPGLLSSLQNGLPDEENRKIAHETSVESVVGSIINQLKRLPLVRRSVDRGRNFRILALDGGGLRGTFTAAVLAKWDDMLGSGGGNSLVSHFDLVAGTSTGAILAIGLGLGIKPGEILNFYRDKGPQIFPKDRTLRHWLRSKHESSTLRGLLEQVYGDRKMSDSSCRLVIPTVRAKHGQAEALVTPHSPDRTAFRDIPAVDAALASSAAPTYFDESLWSGPIVPEVFLDGGVWANNPILPALAESVRHLKIPLDRIDVLSIGTLSSESDFTDSLGRGKAGWALHSVDLFFAAQQHGALLLAESFLGPTRHLRVNQQTPIEIKLDDAEAIDEMAARGNEAGKDSFAAVRSRFLDRMRAPDWKRY